MLTTQYRMHPSIAAWPNQYFYSGCIEQGVTHPEINLAPYTLINSNTTQTGNVTWNIDMEKSKYKIILNEGCRKKIWTKINLNANLIQSYLTLDIKLSLFTWSYYIWIFKTQTIIILKCMFVDNFFVS